MGSGMLWAALGGGARAGAKVLDDQIKREDDERKRALTIEDRKNALLFEMKAKSDFARQEEDYASEVANKVSERGAAIGNERGARELEAARSTVPAEGEFATDRITPEMIASMPPAARAIYERDMGLTDDSTLQGLRDQVSASSELGAPASVRKGLLDSARDEEKSQKNAREQARKELRDEQRYEDEQKRSAQRDRSADQRDAMTAQQFTLAQQQMASAERRAESRASRSSGGAGGVEQTEKLTVLKDVKAKADASQPKLADYRGNTKRHQEAMTAWLDTDDGRISARASQNMLRIFGEGDAGASQPSAAPISSAPTPKGAAKPGSSPWVADDVKAEQVRIIQAELAKDRAKGNAAGVAALERELIRLGAPPAAAQQSAKKDNQATASAPVKVQDKAQYNALPKGARYVAPDGSIRTKG